VLATAATVPPLAAAPRLGGTAHEVKRSETLSGIARQYGITVREIVVANRLPSAKARLQTGHTLTIPDQKNGRAADAVTRQPVKQTVKQAVVERNRARREAMYKEIQRIVLEEGPYVILGYPVRQVAMRNNVKGLDPSPLAFTYNFSDVSKE